MDISSLLEGAQALLLVYMYRVQLEYVIGMETRGLDAALWGVPPGSATQCDLASGCQQGGTSQQSATAKPIIRLPPLNASYTWPEQAGFQSMFNSLIKSRMESTSKASTQQRRAAPTAGAPEGVRRRRGADGR